MNNIILQKGINIAKNLDSDKYRLVAIITNKRGNILSIGCNSYKKTHPRQAYYAKKVGNRYQVFLHAEIDAIVKCRENPYAIYIVRVNSRGKSTFSQTL